MLWFQIWQKSWTWCLKLRKPHERAYDLGLCSWSSAGLGPFLLPLWTLCFVHTLLLIAAMSWEFLPLIFFSRMPPRFCFLDFQSSFKAPLKVISSVRPPWTAGFSLLSFLQTLILCSIYWQSFFGIWYLLFPFPCPVSATGRKGLEAPWEWGQCLSHLVSPLGLIQCLGCSKCCLML